MLKMPKAKGVDHDEVGGDVDAADGPRADLTRASDGLRSGFGRVSDGHLTGCGRASDGHLTD